MKYHALYIIFEKTAKFAIVFCCKIIGGALRVKSGWFIVYIEGSKVMISK